MKQSLMVDKYRLPVEVKRDADGYFVAVCRGWSDCYAQGETVEEAVAELSQVAASLIELHTEEGLKIPLEKLNKNKISLKKLSLDLPLVVSSH